MSRRIEHSDSYASSPAALHAALTDERYWQARIAAVGGPGAALESVKATNDGVQVQLTQAISEEHLPSIVKRVKSGDLIVERTESWGPLDRGAASGTFSATVAGTPIKMRGTHSLSGDTTSCTYRTTGDAQVSVPLIGGKIEQVIVDNITRLLAIEQQFTEQWLAER